ncbi:MAG: ABC transporter substrate-binding protein [Peptococcaceae bacterium]|jgi:branched-chain amino acid transport system substrate-binding protein|nr:ABC transporter substrate-binding protein [Peptococcaceae bacterium]
MKTGKMLMILAAWLLILGLAAGCGAGASGGGTAGDVPGASGGGTAGDVPDGGDTPAPGDAPAVGETGGDIVVGVNFELSGNLAGYGQAKLNGLRIALDEINALGGVLGKTLVVKEYDNKGDNAEAVSLATRLMGEDKVVAMIGPVTSGRVMAAADVARQFGIPLVTGTGTSVGITVRADGEVNPFVYRTCFTDPYQGTLAASYAAGSLGLKTAALLVNQSDDYSIYMASAFQDAFEAAGGQIVDSVSFMQGDLDFRTALTKIKSAGAAMIFCPNYYEPNALIARQALELGYDGYIIGGDGWDNRDHLIQTAGPEALQKVYFINHYFPGDTGDDNQRFVEKYAELYHSAPPSFAALGYDTMWFVADAIEKAGAADPAAIDRAIAGTVGFQGITGTFDMGPNHDPIKSAVVIGFDEEGNYRLADRVR